MPGFTQDEDTSLSLGQLLNTRSGAAAVTFEILAVLGMLPFMYIELCAVLEYGITQWIYNFWSASCTLLLACYLCVSPLVL